jgi:hypothetical protein
MSRDREAEVEPYLVDLLVVDLVDAHDVRVAAQQSEQTEDSLGDKVQSYLRPVF